MGEVGVPVRTHGWLWELERGGGRTGAIGIGSVLHRSSETAPVPSLPRSCAHEYCIVALSSTCTGARASRSRMVPPVPGHV